MNYFELFNVPVSLRPDKQLVRKAYLELSAKYHPDRFGNDNSADTSEVLERSAQVNKAYKTLTNDDEVMRYVLQEKGLLETDEKYALSPEFLMEMMDLNERLPEAMDDEAGQKELMSQIKQTEQEIYEPVKSIIESYQEGVTSEKELLQVKDYYFRKKYLLRLAQQLGQKL